MHKSELEGMTLAELTALAGKLGAELSDDQTTLIYNILDAQSLQAPVDSAPKKRGRKSKSLTPTLSQGEGDKTETSTPPLKETGEAVPAPAPKKRGRKSKAEKEAEEATKAAEAAKEAEQKESETQPAEEAQPEQPAPEKKRRKRIGETKEEKVKTQSKEEP
ncbi:MAG: hypothetical protein IKM68_07100, partial [Bacteroidaceae bacterium]|nr:hypothetical protein [Bacteroidaceae bacterium]